MQLLDSLFLFKSLIKVGCKWHGDVSHRKWSEQLFFTEDIRDRVMEAVANFDPVNDYKIDGCSIWIS